MCGRFTLALDSIELRQAFGLSEMPVEWMPRYNIAPAQPVAVITDAVARKVEFMRWSSRKPGGAARYFENWVVNSLTAAG